MKISLITVCYNSGKTLEDTIKSVLKQANKNYEYLIIDGNSKDNTMDIIKKYEKMFDGRLKYISEKDKGIYDAMNKGIKLATGDIIGLLNSDDVLAHKNVFQKILESFKENIDGTYSDLIFMDEDLKIPVRNFISGKQKNKGWHPAHPTLYLKKEIYEKYGNFDLKYKVTADYDFMLRILKNNLNLIYIKDYLVIMRSGGVSTNGLKGYIYNMKQSYATLRNNKIKFATLITIKRVIKTIFQGIDAKINNKKILKKIK